jgi:hypothetical protein
MTRTSIFAVSAFAALGSSCLVSTEALAFGHGFGGHAFAAQPVAPRPMAATPFSAKRPSFAATHFSKGQIHQANSGNSSHLHAANGHSTIKGSGPHAGTSSAVPASGCGVVCKHPGPGGNNANGGNNGNNGNGGNATATGGNATATGGNSTVNIEGGGAGGGAGDVIGQLATAMSGIGQAQAAAPAQQVAAAPAQQVVTHVQRVVAEPVGFRAIAIGWNNSGAWVVRTSPTLASAGADAVHTCNSQFGECTLSEAQVAPTSFGCLVVVQSDDASRVFAAAGNSSDTALTAAAAQITNAGLHGQIVYTGCNS